MKKLLALLSFVAILGFTTACDNEEPMPPLPTITLSGADIAQTQEIVENMSIVINAAAEGSIADFTVKIDSPFLNSQTLGALGLSTTMSLVNPSSETMAATLSSLGFPVKDQVAGKTSLSINLSKFIPMIAQMYNEDSNHKFILTLTDARGQIVTQTLTCHLSKVGAPVISLDGGDIDKVQDITDQMALVIKVKAPATVAGFKVKIDSPFLTDMVLGMAGLSTELDLVNPTDAVAAALASLQIPNKADVAGKTDVAINLSAFMPMITKMFNETADHKFIITVTDAKGQTTEKTLVCHQTKAAAPTISLEGTNIDEIQEITPALSFILKVDAPATIAGFKVKINSPVLTEQVLAMAGLSTELDLVNPSDYIGTVLSSFQIPTRDQIAGHKNVTINVTPLMQTFAQLITETSDHEFIITVTDAFGQTTEKKHVLRYTKAEAPSIILEGADIDKVQEIKADMALVIKVNAPGSIVAFNVKIDSPFLTDELLGAMGLSTTLDLAHPSDAAAAALSSLGFPVRDKVLGQKELTLNLSAFMPMLAQLCPITSDHKFTITITDAINQTTTRTITCRLTK